MSTRDSHVSLSTSSAAAQCRFAFSDGRRCRMPRASGNAHFCAFHAQKLARSQSAEELAREISFYFSGEYISANDVTVALSRLIPAILRGDIGSRQARTLAYLAQTLTQLIRTAEHEFTNAFGTDTWRRAIRNSVRSNFARRNPSPPLPISDPQDSPSSTGTLACAASTPPPAYPPASPVATSIPATAASTTSDEIKPCAAPAPPPIASDQQPPSKPPEAAPSTTAAPTTLAAAPAPPANPASHPTPRHQAAQSTEPISYAVRHRHHFCLTPLK